MSHSRFRISTEAQRFAYAALAAALCIAVVRYIHAESFRTLLNAHGVLHVAVIQQFHGLGDFGRPENPFFAGEPIPYYWVFHYLAAGISSVTGLHALLAVEVMIAIGIVVLWIVASLIGKRLFGGIAGGLLIGFLALAGTNPAGGWKLLGLIAAGRSLPVDDGRYLWGLVHPAMKMARISDNSGLYGPLTNFFINVTSRPVGLVLLLVTIWCLAEYLARGRRKWLLGVAAAAGLNAAVAPLIGLPAGLSLAGSLVVIAALPARFRLGVKPVDVPRQWLAAAGAIVAGTLLASPTYYFLFALAGGDGLVFDLRLQILVAVVASGGPLAILGIIGVIRHKGLVRQILAALCLASAVQFVANLVIVLPHGNDANFFHSAGFLLAPAAAAALVPAEGWSRRLRILVPWAAVAFFSLSSIVVILSYLDRPSINAQVTDGKLLRLPRGGALARGYAWMRNRSEPDAIIVADPRRPILTAMGNQPELPAITRRALFTAHLSSYMVDAYPDAPTRVEIATRLVEGKPLEPAQVAYLKQFTRPMYILTLKNNDPAVSEGLRRRNGAPAFSADSVAIYRYSAEPAR